MINGNDNCLYGLTAEFKNAETLLKAIRTTIDAGYSDIRVYSPYHVEGLDKMLNRRSPLLPWLILGGIIVGVITAYILQYWTTVLHYPINVGGRPLNPWPAYLPIMFELAVLFSALAAAGYMFIRNGFPAPYHPIFNADGIEGATRNRFFLCIRVNDDKFDMEDTATFLQGLGPVNVSEVLC